MKKRSSFLLALIVSMYSMSGMAKMTPSPELTSQIADRYAEHIFYGSGASGMAMVVIDGNQRVFTGLGETRPGNHIRPQKDSLIRIASLSKLMTTEILVKLANAGTVRVNDPLTKYAPKGARVPAWHGQNIRLINLATHSAGLPREMPGGKPHRPVFTWPVRSQRWVWLAHARLKYAPGSVVSYSNLGFDLLADALSHASGRPYPQLLQRLITRPLGMKDTTFTPSPDQCARLMIPEQNASPCDNTLAAIGSGGVYSTPDDMGRWMQQFLSTAGHPRSPLAGELQKMVFSRASLTRVSGMDVAGHADAIGMGWLHMAATDDTPALIEKTGGGGGFMTYIAMSPQHNIGVFIVVARSSASHFAPMSDGVNQLIAELVRNHR
ncbi:MULTISPECIES: D-alanyl-D-alanine-carboxypeptidase/endopeptidase AmpH [unclassified Tatumella]|uniref:D-alanyl-D-alanine- carboxypeptidase/endopeptidase AmpH n=1 Tax=unclassified Tatumella TaxID=2649542 RepID=UPI001BAF912A|nr:MULTISPECIES: D-alanyl-D-alanine-carboxypeptidase/endopeptidase AmpH [unclassified Tatumella]MBS0857340.1 D-alanyl-D-alanine-carboxypeptidase/endopeptidase AmpH [Tatumella sp. JGM16]MBS0914093.1 D-alanyl-D-alanine-carboxypeptidase/endopeptidase AmpH [Tatumella sp. JGM91]